MKGIEATFRAGDYARVIHMCNEFLADQRCAEYFPELLLWKGFAHGRTGAIWFGAALDCYAEGLRLAKDDTYTQARLLVAQGQIYAQTVDCHAFGRVMQEFKSLAERDTNNSMVWAPWLWYNYGCALHNAERLGDAEIAFETALDLSMSTGDFLLSHVIHNLGGVKLKLGKFSEALKLMTAAEEFQTISPPKLLNRRAEYYLAVGDYLEARSSAARALEHPDIDDMTSADALYSMAQALRCEGNATEAKERALAALDHAIKDVYYVGIQKLNSFLQELI